MRDVLFLAVVIAFFALAAGFVKICDRIIGPDDADLDHTRPAAREDVSV